MAGSRKTPVYRCVQCRSLIGREVGGGLIALARPQSAWSFDAGAWACFPIPLRQALVPMGLRREIRTGKCPHREVPK